MFVHTGDYVRHINDDVLHSIYYTFTPCPLLEGNFYTMDDALATLLSEAHRALGILEGITLSLSDSGCFARLMLLRESCFSKMIDYPDLNVDSILMNRALGKADDRISNIMAAYQYAMNTDVQTLNPNRLASCVLLGNDTKQRTHTRTKPLFLTNSAANYPQYNPTAPENITAALADISKYVETSQSDPLIKAAMCHYQFEMIHPLECHNGIAGRILIYQILNGAGLSSVYSLSLSEVLYRHKEEYFERLGLAQKNGRYHKWIVFFLQAIDEAAHSSVQMIKDYQKFTHLDEEKILANRNRSDHALEVYQYFKEHIISDVGTTSRQLHLSFNVVSRSIDMLQKLGIVAQITTGSRNRLFAYSDMMQLITF